MQILCLSSERQEEVESGQQHRDGANAQTNGNDNDNDNDNDNAPKEQHRPISSGIDGRRAETEDEEEHELW